MKIYNYDNNGKYVGSSEADNSPLEDGIYLIPANATDKKIPVEKYGFDIFWNGSAWEYRELPKEKPMRPNSYSVWNEALWIWVEDEALKSLFDDGQAKNAKQLALSTITVTTSNGNTFDGNETARINMISAITVADIAGITEKEWKLADNSVKVITLAELKEALLLSIQRVGEIVL